MSVILYSIKALELYFFTTKPSEKGDRSRSTLQNAAVKLKTSCDLSKYKNYKLFITSKTSLLYSSV